MCVVGIPAAVYCGLKGNMSQPHRLKNKSMMCFLSVPTLCGNTNRVMVRVHPRESKPMGPMKKELPLIVTKGSVKFFFDVFGPVPRFISPGTIRPT